MYKLPSVKTSQMYETSAFFHVRFRNASKFLCAENFHLHFLGLQFKPQLQSNNDTRNKIAYIYIFIYSLKGKFRSKILHTFVSKT